MYRLNRFTYKIHVQLLSLNSRCNGVHDETKRSSVFRVRWVYLYSLCIYYCISIGIPLVASVCPRSNAALDRPDEVPRDFWARLMHLWDSVLCRQINYVYLLTFVQNQQLNTGPIKPIKSDLQADNSGPSLSSFIGN